MSDALLTITVRCPKADSKSDPYGEEHYMLVIDSYTGTIPIAEIVNLQACRCGVDSSAFAIVQSPERKSS